MILSDKSSGSSMLQRELARHPDVNVVRWTKHQENETLYWNKAAIVLGLPHEKLYRSILPMSEVRARDELVEFLTENLGAVPTQDANGDWLFEGWRALCDRFEPVFLEKSPHHIHCRSALSLIKECALRYPELGFRYIGLVRNPISTLYSMWKRWTIHPEKKQNEWITAHRNMLQFLNEQKTYAIRIKYEDIVIDTETIGKIFNHINVDNYDHIFHDIHRKSIESWKHDESFRWVPSSDLQELAATLGYSEEDVYLKGATLRWFVTSHARAGVESLKEAGRLARRALRNP